MRIGPVIVACSGIGLDRMLRIEGDPKCTIGVIFSPDVLPILGSEQTLKGRAILSKHNLEIKYKVRIDRETELGIEEQTKIADIAVHKKGKYYEGEFHNRSTIRDFTTPYLAFGISGAATVGLFSMLTRLLTGLI